MTARKQLHKLIDGLDDSDAAEVLAHLKALLSDGTDLSDAALDQTRRADAEIARGEYVTMTDLRNPVSA